MTSNTTSAPDTNVEKRDIATVLIANRGEIAVRVMRTLRRMGIRSVAVYTDADASALHVREADVAINLDRLDVARGDASAPVRTNYLSIPAVIEACRISGADGVHPGYGFLSENAKFADILAAHKITFIGPRADHIRVMGDKIEAKRTAQRLGIPVVPGSDGAVNDEATAKKIAAEIGYQPVTAYLTQRALEIEQARIERLQARLLERQRMRRELRYARYLRAEDNAMREESRLRAIADERLAAIEARRAAEAEAAAIERINAPAPPPAPLLAEPPETPTAESAPEETVQPADTAMPAPGTIDGDGVVRAPSALGMTVGSPPSRTETTEFVVPRSIPTARAIRVIPPVEKWFISKLMCCDSTQRPPL